MHDIVEVIHKCNLHLLYSWYCHFDDDEYVNTAELPRALFHHCQNPTEEKCYLGRWPGWPAKGNGIGVNYGSLIT